MDRTALHSLVDRLVDVEADGVAGLDREAAGAVLGEIARLRSWAEHLRLGVVARVAELSPTPERDIADADGSSARGAARDITTAQTLGGGQLGGTAESLAAGATTRGHIDVLADAYRSLDSSALRERFAVICPASMCWLGRRRSMPLPVMSASSSIACGANSARTDSPSSGGTAGCPSAPTWSAA